MEDEKVTININKMQLGIGLIILGIITLISADLIFYGEFGIKLFGYILFPIGWGFITKHIMPNQKGSFMIGVALGLIGVIIALIITHKNNNKDKNKNNNNSNKYEDLQKLAELKQKGILTEKEFEEEKEKLLK